jgi:hypothetical protein
MGSATERCERPLIAIVIAMLAAVLATELYHHALVKPVPLSMLLFELLEVLLLVGCAVACTLLVLRVQVRVMAAAAAAMLAVLLAGELYLGVKPTTPSMLLVELLEVALVVSGTLACALLLRRAS